MRSVTLLATASIFAITVSALAQSPHRQRDVSMLNCATLKGKPFVCILNESDDIITDIDCEGTGGFFGSSTKAIPMPKGGIAPHSLTVLDIHGRCTNRLVFSVLGGAERKTDKIDTDQATIIEVPRR